MDKMNVGMLWLDNDTKRPFDEKVQRAVEYYQQKYGQNPEVCFVNPTMIGKSMKVGKVSVEPFQSIMPHHFWLGMKNS